MIVNIVTPIKNSTNRNKESRKRFKETNNMSKFVIDKRRLIESFIEPEEELNDHSSYLSGGIDNRLNKNYKKTKSIISLVCSGQSLLSVKWDYRNPCELYVNIIYI